jgi:hypothetical protein
MEYTQIAFYMFAGACFFSILGFIAAKYRGDTADFKTGMRDAISGAFLTAFLTYLIPGYFPDIDVQQLIPVPVKLDTDMDIQFRMPK